MSHDSSISQLGQRFCAAPLPDTVAADLVALKPMPDRRGTNLMTVAEADQVMRHVAAPAIEEAFRAGFAAAEEVLGAHGSEWMLAAIERRWADYVADTGLSS